MRSRFFVLTVGLAACATLADTGGGDANIPNASAGPFREIDFPELGNSRAAPNALKSDRDYPHDGSMVDVDGDPATLEVWAYVSRTQFADDDEPDPAAPPTEIARYIAVDGRSFSRTFDTVLRPIAAWEGGVMETPSALRVGESIWLYYAAAGGIGLATSDDGVTFLPASNMPVLAVGDAGWDAGSVPTSPSVVRLPDGNFHMFYQAAFGASSAIGEARSADGVVWQRVGDAPAIAPRGPSPDPMFPAPDAVSVASPAVVLAASATDRQVEFVYYAAVDDNGRSTIALAARYGFDGPLSRGTSPVFGGADGLQPGEPAVIRFADFTLLYVTQKAGPTDGDDFPAIAVGVAPADRTLPAPEPR